VVSDKGSAFTSQAFKVAYELQQIKLSTAATGHLQSNGMVDEENRTLMDVSSIKYGGIEKQWPKVIKELEYSLNTKVHYVTKHSPYELVYGHYPPGTIYADV